VECAHPDWQRADRIAVGVEHEGALGGDRDLGRAQDPDLGETHMSALEDLRQVRQEAQPRHAFDQHDVEEAVVEQRAGRDLHATTVVARVRRGDRVAGELDALAWGIELDLEADRPPGGERTERAIGVDEVPEPRRRLVGDAVGLAVEAGAGDAYERPAIDLSEVQRTRLPVRDHLARRKRILRYPKDAREVVAAAAGQDPEDRARHLAQRVGRSAGEPIPAEDDGELPGVRRRAGERAGVIEVAGLLVANGKPAAAQRLHDLRCHTAGTSAAGGRVDDQANRAGSRVGHRASLVGAGGLFASGRGFLKNAQRVRSRRLHRIYAAGVSAERPTPRRAAGGRALGAMALAGAALLITACGSSAGAGTLASSGTNPSGTTTAAQTCSRATAPTPRGPQHIPPPHVRLDPAKSYTVKLTTNCGAIAIRLDVKQAPRTTASFAYLVRRGFYNDLTFHRVAANFVIQGGDPNGDGSGGPGYTVVEPPPSNLRYTLGTVAMAKTATAPSGASGSQFFIVTTQEAQLPAQYALVGKVVGSLAGMETIASLPTVPPQDGAPVKPVVIGRATLSES
jgi:peptidyl-prolyl cis-trans isomerase B (cyclophilin B)